MGIQDYENIKVPNRMTLQEILATDNRIEPLLDRAGRDRRSDKCRLYSQYKRELQCLVGWRAEDKRLRTSGVYDTTIRALCDKLKY